MAQSPFKIRLLSQKTATLLLLLQDEIEKPEELAALSASAFNDGLAFALKTIAEMNKK